MLDLCNINRNIMGRMNIESPKNSKMRTFVWGGGADYAPINIITKFGKIMRIKIEDYDSKNTGVF